MPHWFKKTIQWMFCIFILWAILTSPNRAADLVLTVWEIIMDGVAAIAQFFDRLLGA